MVTSVITWICYSRVKLFLICMKCSLELPSSNLIAVFFDEPYNFTKEKKNKTSFSLNDVFRVMS